MVVCNPPYISSTEVELMPNKVSGCEPHLAFDGGPFGVKFMLRLVREAHRFLRPGSWLCFEVGLGQEKAVEAKCRRAGHYRNVQSLRNTQG
jgi:release factor glutamine methyltransferase